MRIILRLTIILYALLATVIAEGRQLSVNEALARVKQQNLSEPLRKKAEAAMAATVAYTSVSTDGNKLYYAVNLSQGGFMILSADDTFMPVIAYSTEGKFDFTALPDNMRSMLAVCDAAIGDAISSGQKYVPEQTTTDRSVPIEPMITAKWDQSFPYNNECPLYNGRATMTGCVATAMAQVMHYFRYPVSGRGSYSYEWKNSSQTDTYTTLSADFANETYRWDDMIDSYGYLSSESSQEAVARLMYHCGISVNMYYGTSMSAANVYNVPAAMHNYFGYDDAIAYHNRRTYTLDAWNSLIYNELRAGRPVLYSGSDDTVGGHFFVCDGCDGNDFFHINWGWSGSSNVYFKLNALNAAGYKFNSLQGAVTGIYPDDGVNSPSFNIVGMGRLKIYYKDSGKTYQRYSNGTQYLMPTSSDFNYGFYNFDWHGATPNFGVILENLATGEVTTVKAYSYTPTELGMGKNIRDFQVHNRDLPAEGSFKMFPAATDSEGNWHKIPFDVSSPQYLYLDITPTTVTFTDPDEGLPSLQVDADLPQGNKWMNYAVDIPVRVTNVGDAPYSESLYVRYQRDCDNNVWTQVKKTIDVETGETLETSLTITPRYEGRYRVEVQDNTGHVVVERFEFTVKSAWNPLEMEYAGEPTLEISSADDSTSPTGLTLNISVPVGVKYGYFYGSLSAEITKTEAPLSRSGDDNIVATLKSKETHSIYEGNNKTFTFSGAIPNEPGEYNVRLLYDDDDNIATEVSPSDQHSASITYIIDEESTTAVAQIESDTHTDSWNIYNLSGVLIYTGRGELPTLAPGCYILRRGLTSTKLFVH